MTDLISIVLPTYNGEKYLAESLDSILAQTWQNWELIIVNDCSTDSTLRIAEDYAAKNSRIRVTTNETNLRLPASLNRGFSLAKGEYLTWTSDDNRYKPPALERMVATLKKNPDAALIYADLDNIDSEGAYLSGDSWPEPDNLPFYNNIGACFMYRRFVLADVGGYDDSFFCAEDYDYWFRIYLRYPIIHLTENLYEYRQHPGSLTSRKRQQVEAAVIEIQKKYLEKIPGLSKSDRAAIIAKKFRFCLMNRFWPLVFKSAVFGFRSAGLRFGGRFLSITARIFWGMLQKYVFRTAR